jgi:hypothetical protein
MSEQRSVASGVFGPTEIANLSAAYQAALSAIDEGRDVLAHVPGHELRRKLASRIIEEAARGELDPDQLAQAALARLA